MPAPPRLAPLARLAAAHAALLAVAFAGGAIMAGLGAPAGWLSGSMIATILLAAAGGATPLAAPVRSLAILLTGVTMGSGATPEALATMARYPASLALMAVALAAMTASAYFVILRDRAMSRATALHAAIPGALSYVMIAATGAKADLPKVAVIQVFRLFVLMAIVPMAAARLSPAAGVATILYDPVPTTAALTLLSGAVGFVALRMGAAMGLLYGAIAVSAIAHGFALAPGRPQPDVQIAAQTLVGAWVGTRFIGFDWRLMGQLIPTAVGALIASLSAAAAFAALTAALVDVPFIEALAAFAPGGLEVMTMMAFALGLDPLYVGAHHLARFFLISLALPAANKALTLREARAPLAGRPLAGE